jgi:SpoVK/Ycf46/Vps4 family AAA+-type ATPase
MLIGTPQVRFVGDEYYRFKEEILSIINYQVENRVRNGIKGFFLYGKAGTGKTRLVLEIVKELKHKGFVFYFYDSADVAHKHYGESEKIIRDIFSKEGERRAIFFDDVDGLFITRDYGVKLETWYLSHLNVLFHEIDNLDTSKDVIFLTTNKADLVDFALIDRLYALEIPPPSKNTMKEYTRERLIELKMANPAGMITGVEKKILELIDAEKIDNFRTLEKTIIREYVNWVKKRGK